MITGIEYLLIFLGALAAGTVNALAGGGTLITFPLLTAVGLPAVSANVTNTVALCPGFLGGSLAQAKELGEQRRRLWIFLPLSAIGGLIGGLILLYTGERVFRAIVPYLILIACGLLAAQEPLRGWLCRRAQSSQAGERGEKTAALPVLLATVYGGYFGAGMSVIVLAVLGLTVDDTLTRLNAVKQSVALVTNMTAAVYFLFSGQVVWAAALVMAVGALLGGSLGGRLAGKVKPTTLRWIVVTIGLIVATIYLLR